MIQERRSVVESKPLAILDELITAALYLNHPYRIPVIKGARDPEAVASAGARVLQPLLRAQ